MGKTQSKSTDNNGEINNIIKVDSAVPIGVEAWKVEMMLVALIALVAASTLYQYYKDYTRGLRKQILRRTASTNMV